MTRYQAAMSTFSIWVTKARAPSGDDITRELGKRAPIARPMGSATRQARGQTLPPRWQRAAASFEHPPLLVRLWRAMGGDSRHGINSHE
jgi:hypothetical protein